MIVIGQVSKADPENGSVRVAFADRDDMVSAPLPVIAPGGWARGVDVPGPEETVLCVFLDNSRSVGFCLGGYFTSDDPAPGTSDQNGKWFEDGSYVYYDRSIKTLKIKAASGVAIEGKATIKGDVSITGDLNVTGTVTASHLQEG